MGRRTKQMVLRRAAAFVVMTLASSVLLNGQASAASPTSADLERGAESLLARGAVEGPALGAPAMKSRRNVPCPDGKTGCYAVLTATRGKATTTTLNGKPASLAGSYTFWVSLTYHNFLGQSMWSANLSAADWFNGWSAGQYWTSGSHTWYAPFWNGNVAYGGFWNGSVWAWNNWGNFTEDLNLGLYHEHHQFYIRIYVQPNGRWWWWWAGQ